MPVSRREAYRYSGEHLVATLHGSPVVQMYDLDVDPYRSSLWKAFRDEVIGLDGGVCVRCGRGRDDGVQLCVHHTRYLPGHKPWEYPHDMCDTLCKGCHAAEHGLIPPKFGWRLLGFDDLGEPDGNCELCSQEIRYVYLVSHSQWHPLEVGADCCDNLVGTMEASNHLESLVRYAKRLKTFVSSTRWKPVVDGSERFRRKSMIFEVLPRDSGFKVRLNGAEGKQLFASPVEAKRRVFELLETGEAEDYLARTRAKISARLGKSYRDFGPQRK